MQRLIHPHSSLTKGLPTLADKIGMVFGTSTLKNCKVTILFLFQRNLSAREIIYSYRAVTFDETLFVYGKNNGFTTND